MSACLGNWRHTDYDDDDEGDDDDDDDGDEDDDNLIDPSICEWFSLQAGQLDH